MGLVRNQVWAQTDNLSTELWAMALQASGMGAVGDGDQGWRICQDRTSPAPKPHATASGPDNQPVYDQWNLQKGNQATLVIHVVAKCESGNPLRLY